MYLSRIDKKSLKKCHQYDQQFKLLLLLQIAKQDTKKERKHLKEVKHHAESKSWTPKATKDVVSEQKDTSIDTAAFL